MKRIKLVMSFLVIVFVVSVMTMVIDVKESFAASKGENWVAWQDKDQDKGSDLYLWNGESIRRLAKEIGVFDINSNGEVVWAKISKDREIVNIYLWNEGVVRKITSLKRGYLLSLNINNNGWIVWEANKKICLWNKKSIHELSEHGECPQINANNWVAWIEESPEDISWYQRICLWNGESVQRIKEINKDRFGGLQINNNGWLVWREEALSRKYEVFLWNGKLISKLISAEDSRHDPLEGFQINDKGKVVIWGDDLQGISESSIFLWNGNSLQKLKEEPSSYVKFFGNFLSEEEVQERKLEDRGAEWLGIFSVCINNRDQIVCREYGQGGGVIWYWEGGLLRILPKVIAYSGCFLDMNDNGWVVWYGSKCIEKYETGKEGIFLWDREKISKLVDTTNVTVIKFAK